MGDSLILIIFSVIAGMVPQFNLTDRFAQELSAPHKPWFN